MIRPLPLVTLLLTLPTLAAPATTRTATTRPAEDGSGPRAALLLYDKLVGPNEADKAIGLYHATTTRERALATSLASFDGALANLHRRARDKFGRDAADTLVRAVDGVTVPDINAAKIKVTGETASVLFAGSPTPTTMIRIDDEWKISVKKIVQQLRSRPRDYRNALAKLTTATNKVAAKIRDGQYPNPDAAKKELEAASKTTFGGE